MVPPGESSHYFDTDPSSPSDRRLVDLVLPDLTLKLQTDRGVFARDGVDTGTKLLLLDGPPSIEGDTVLMDLGAGYGPIACALAIRNPEATVWAVEINGRARELCQLNVDRAKLKNVVVAAPEEVPADLVVDRIWSNPPIRIGKAALHQLLDQWLATLSPDGSAHLVVQRHLGADSLQRRLIAEGWTVVRRGSKKAFRLLDLTGTPPEQEGS